MCYLLFDIVCDVYVMCMCVYVHVFVCACACVWCVYVYGVCMCILVHMYICISHARMRHAHTRAHYLQLLNVCVHALFLGDMIAIIGLHRCGHPLPLLHTSYHTRPTHIMPYKTSIHHTL